MSYAGHASVVHLIAILCVGSAIPQAGWTHSEGIEAADPSTPAAMLSLESATIRYLQPNAEPLQWRELFDATADSAMPEASSNERSEYTDTTSTTPATKQQ